ncbi:hypothetical protein [Rahnella selenatireducens]|uniref:hypothetical protein n=1 Tax=Rahnella selenatireducens TaxID=3389797 RepID=UPI0039693FC8
MLNENKSDALIAINGAISPEVVKTLGAEIDLFILGTAGLFRKDMSYKEAMTVLHEQVVLPKGSVEVA